MEAVLNHQDAAVEDTTAGWVDEARPTVHADILVQLEDPPKVSPNPKDWKCALCDKCDNLWMKYVISFPGPQTTPFLSFYSDNNPASFF